MDELKTQALIQEIEEQRSWALTRCAQMRAELAKAGGMLAEAQKEIESMKAQLAGPKEVNQ